MKHIKGWLLVAFLFCFGITQAWAQADVQAAFYTVVPTTLAPKQNVTMHFRVFNAGNQPTTGEIRVRLYYSEDPVIETTDAVLGEGYITGMTVGQSNQFLRSVPIPVTATPGTRYVGVIVDYNEQEAESDETNNIISQAITVDPPLPVELTAFEARVLEATVLLWWETVSEINNAGFEVQQQREGLFVRVGYVEGHGTTHEPRAYTYKAANLTPGNHTFRLKQVDFDGHFTYSPEVEARVEVPGVYHLSTAYPNPFNAATTFTLTVPHAQHVRIEVLNLLGHRLSVLHDGPLVANDRYRFTLEANGLPSGMYLIRVKGASFVASRMVSRLK